MQILLIVGVTLLTAGAPEQGQATGLGAAPSLNLTFVKGSLEDALSTISRLSGVVIEIDRSVSEEIRKDSIAGSGPIRLIGASVEETIELLTTQRGLSYTILEPKTVRISKKV